MKTRMLLAASSALTAMLAIASTANAQSDPSLRNDARADAAAPRLPSLAMPAAAEEEGPSLDFNFGLGGGATTNAGFTADDEQASHYLSPSLIATYRYPNLVSRWTFQARASANAAWYEDSAFDEGVGAFDVQLARTLRENESLSLFHRSTAFFDGDFGEQFGSQRDYGVGYARRFGAAQENSLQLSAYWQDARSDRAVLRAGLAHDFAGRALGASWSAGQRLQYSNYSDDARDDALLSTTSLGPTWTLGAGELSLEASYVHNFSDAGDVDVFEIGPAYSVGF